MANTGDRKHFEDYREQTRVKHEILVGYLQPYFKIVGGSHNKLLYIDAFAGRGAYTEADTGRTVDGSPMRALKLIASDEKLLNKVRTLFIEADDLHYKDLEAAVASFSSAHPGMQPPIIFQGTFSDGVQKILQATNRSLPPTFLFVDPCGVSGASFETIKTVMAARSSEAFIFFNIDGVRRTAGLDKKSAVLVELLGSERRAIDIVDQIRTAVDANLRETLILESYREALRTEMGMAFTIPFRIESAQSRRTSHYLIHATKHELGFRIMKEVMWARGHSQEGPGGLEFAQASRTKLVPLFPVDLEPKQNILDVLANGPRPVSLFLKEWVLRPDDYYCEPAYRQMLLDMESEGAIEVLDNDGFTPRPSGSRPKIKGKRTLGHGYFVKLRRR